MVRNWRKVHHIVRDATNLALSKSPRRFRTLESQVAAATGVKMMILRWCGFWSVLQPARRTMQLHTHLTTKSLGRTILVNQKEIYPNKSPHCNHPLRINTMC